MSSNVQRGEFGKVQMHYQHQDQDGETSWIAEHHHVSGNERFRKTTINTFNWKSYQRSIIGVKEIQGKTHRLELIVFWS